MTLRYQPLHERVLGLPATPKLAGLGDSIEPDTSVTNAPDLTPYMIAIAGMIVVTAAWAFGFAVEPEDDQKCRRSKKKKKR